MKQAGTNNQILNPIKDVLSAFSLNDVKLNRNYRIPKTSLSADAVIQLPKNIGISKLIVEYKKTGEPRIIRQAALTIKKYLENLESAYGVIVAPYVSNQAARICEEEGVGYIDLSGNCYLRFGNVLIEKSGRPNKFVVRKEQRSLFSDKATRVLRVLLTNPQKKWGVRELAKAANVSAGYVSRIRRNLTDREWMSLGQTDIKLNNPKQVLDEWVRAKHLRKSETFEYFTLKKPIEIETELAQYCVQKKIDYALSGFSGAIRYAPMVPAKSVMVYVSGDIPKLASDLGLKSVETGANVTLAIPYDESIFYDVEVIDNIKIASPIQVYLDLIDIKGRGEEAALAVFDKKVSSLW